MTDLSSIAPAMAAAAQSLRDTARWLVGGVIATCAAIFAGSSLSNLGELDPAQNTGRLSLAIVGILIGFAALALIFYHAIRVLSRESLTFREIALPSAAETKEIADLRQALLRRYRDRLPNGANTFQEYIGLVDQAIMRHPRTQDDLILLNKAERDNAIFTADGAFLFVKARFEKLVCVMWLATAMAIVGFGLFAWSANPPKNKSSTQSPSSINVRCASPL